MTHDGELCSSLPLTQLSFAAWYCHHHQGWCWSVRIHDQTTDDVLQTIHAHDGDLGPFDDAGDLVHLFEIYLDVVRRHIDTRSL